MYIGKSPHKKGSFSLMISSVNMTKSAEDFLCSELNDIVNKYNNTYHITMKMKPDDIKPSTHIDSSKELNY